ncbi:hypothetical protein ACH5RR_022579 [Cinchona calisaya]|uniref:Uncharacterized protein n=1 Tax=Cinchona calisaya TaxID=153742 RepID=A0ABD2ZBD3_9GENT
MDYLRGLNVTVDAVVYLVDAYNKEHSAESKKELDAFLSDEALANVPFLILGNKIDIPYAASEDELHYHLGLTGVTTGRILSIHSCTVKIPTAGTLLSRDEKIIVLCRGKDLLPAAISLTTEEGRKSMQLKVKKRKKKKSLHELRSP